MLSKLPRATHLVSANAKIQTEAFWLKPLCLLSLHSRIACNELVEMLIFPCKITKALRGEWLLLLFLTAGHPRTKFNTDHGPNVAYNKGRNWNQHSCPLLVWRPYSVHDLFPQTHTPPKRIIVFPAFYSATVWHKHSSSHSLHVYFLTMKYHILPQWTTAQLNWYLLLTESEDSGRQLIYFLKQCPETAV